MKQFSRIMWVFLVLIFTVTGCESPALTLSPKSSTAPTLAPDATSQPPGSIAAIEGTIESIYAQVNPSVVNIEVLQKQQSSTFPAIPGFIPGAPQQFSSASGSGFVWDTDGHVVTNNHVVSGADSVSVTFYDGTVVPATIVGTDSDSDLAVIKVDLPAQQLLPVKIADSTQLKVGQLAIAIGNPFGLQGTLTVGYVSGVGRLLPTDQSGTGPSYTIPDIIQTDAALNPGNSGGVLLNDAGMVIGVTSAIESPSGTSAGVGFAIPSAIVQKVVPDLITTGHYNHPWIGISGISLNPDIAKAMNLNSNQRGALVEDITPSSPAAKAGLRGSDQPMTINGQKVRVGGDVIIGIDSQTVKSFDDVVAYLALSASVGETITLTVLRDAKEVPVQVTLASRPTSS
jgi:serine protease Do